MYDLIITKLVNNPDYEAQTKRLEEDRRWRGDVGTMPTPTIEVRQIKCVLTDLEFETIKRALIESWK